MELVYHTLITCRAVGDRFGPEALAQVIRANHSQDSMLNQLRGQLHFDNRIADGLAYLEAQHSLIEVLASDREAGGPMREAFGRLAHTAQDFYAHTNYVWLWVTRSGGLEATSPDDINALDGDLMAHPDLRTGSFALWRDWVYYVPFVKHVARRLYVPAGSHEAMHLDAPGRGAGFAYAFAAACKRTEHEYQRAMQTILTESGRDALVRFHHV